MAHNISWKLVALAKFLKSQNFKTTFQKKFNFLSELIQKNQFAMTDPVEPTHLSNLKKNSSLPFY